MIWTRDKPTVPGWYWFWRDTVVEDGGKTHITYPPEITFVEEGQLDVEKCQSCGHERWTLLQFPALWAGPIPEPEEKP